MRTLGRARSAPLAQRPLVVRATAASRPVRRRVMTAHRRYASANGDALAGALSYALLVGLAPAVLLAGSAATALGARPAVVADVVRDLAGLVLPEEAAVMAAGLPTGPVAWRPLLAAALLWATLRLTRALRTGVRAMCGQNAGSGNPFRDAALDAALTAWLCTLTATAAIAVHLGTLPGALALWALFAAVMRHTPWRAPGRPSRAAALRAALFAALLSQLLTRAAHHYLQATAALHDELYRSAGALIGVLIWCGLIGRVLLRATAWAATSKTSTRPEQPGREKDGEDS